jgi:hypothetical protein
LYTVRGRTPKTKNENKLVHMKEKKEAKSNFLEVNKKPEIKKNNMFSG